MYGTVARMRVKAGQEKALTAMMDVWNKERRPKVKGAKGTYVYQLDKNPREFIMAVVFEDKKSYVDNAHSPDQDKWYQGYRKLLETDPEWNDGEIVWTG